MSNDSTTWLVCGASPSVPEHLDQAYEHAGGTDANSIACNSAIYRWLIRDEPLDFYWLHDADACRRYRDYAKYLQRIDGMRVITLDDGSGPDTLAARGIEYADEFIQAVPPNYTVSWERGQYTNTRTSGGIILQYAVNHGATEVHIVGMEGFKSRPGNVVVDHFDGSTGREQNNFVTKAYQVPLFKLIAAKCPDVDFHFYGKPAVPFEGPNIQWHNKKELMQCA